jgi:hypothetical protein
MPDYNRQAPHAQDLNHSLALVGMHTQNDTQTKHASVPKKSKSKYKSGSKSDDNASLFSTSSFSSTKQLLKEKFSSFSSSSSSEGKTKSERPTRQLVHPD